mmetsp:Transcript_10310/g.35898  ORF Transcript_10310/g.35898 Transcript_10310/m.35898 type:complete len:215 (-) Transcript_10310:356-1000(-)
MKRTPRALHAACRALKNPADAWLSPPSACTGSTIRPATPLSWSMMRSTSFRHRASSAPFAASLPASGYFSLGKGAIGQSNAGTSSLCIALECVVERQPRSRPWKAPSNESILRSFADPGSWLDMQLAVSSAVGVAPPRSSRLLAMKTALYAFSLAQEPHIIGATCDIPGGAQLSSVDLTRSGQPLGGALPSAGRCASSGRFAGSVNTPSMAGWL